MKNYDDRLEKSMTAIFGTIGTLAVLINLFLKGLTIENILDSLKDIAGLVVVIAPDSHCFLIPITCRDADSCGFGKVFIVLCHSEINRSEVLQVLLSLVKPEGDFNVVFHGKNV